MQPTRPSLPGAEAEREAAHRNANGKPVSHERHTGKYGSDAHLVFHQEAHEAEPAAKLRELFRPFVIRQVGRVRMLLGRS